MLKCDFNKIALQRHTGKQRPRTLEHPWGPRTPWDPGHLGIQDPWGPKTLEDAGPYRTQVPRGPRTLEDQGNLDLYHRTTSFERNTLQSKILIGSNDKIVENKNCVINLLILNEKDLWEISDCIQTIAVVIKT